MACYPEKKAHAIIATRMFNPLPGSPLSKLGLRQGRLNPVIWLTVITLSFLPAGYFFREDPWLAYFLVGLPFVAFLVTLGIAWWWAICKPDLLLSEDYNALKDMLANAALTKEGAIPAGELMAKPAASEPEAAKAVPSEAANPALSNPGPPVKEGDIAR